MRVKAGAAAIIARMFDGFVAELIARINGQVAPYRWSEMPGGNRRLTEEHLHGA
jgi:hypothetical protein